MFAMHVCMDAYVVLLDLDWTVSFMCGAPY